MSSKSMKILIAYGGSEHSKAALDDLRRADLPAKARAVAPTAVDIWIPPYSIPGSEFAAPAAEQPIAFITSRQRTRVMYRLAQRRAAETLKDARALAPQIGGRVESFFPEWQVRAEASAGSPASLIMRRARIGGKPT